MPRVGGAYRKFRSSYFRAGTQLIIVCKMVTPRDWRQRLKNEMIEFPGVWLKMERIEFE